VPELVFKGKEFVYNHHLSVPFRPLVANADKGIGDASLDDNLIIHGDNLHALKALLPMYAGKVDCIFIDPPYNTGNEGWSYNDNVNSPMLREWLNSNPITIEDGLRHDKWAAMMYPRLKLLHELLNDEGSLWMTISDHEGHRARLLLDEIFGEDSFVASVVWQKRTSPEARVALGAAHDYVLVYSKRPGSARFAKLRLTEEQASAFSNPDNDPRGEWTSTDMTAQGYRKNQMYEIVTPAGSRYTPPPGRCWSLIEPEFNRLRSEGRIWFGVNGDARPRLKTYLDESEGVSAWTWWPNTEVGDNQEAKKEAMRILGAERNFDYPKPVSLVSRVLELASRSDSLVLDSFAGSGTTGHAVLAANAKDGGDRKFILVEMEGYADDLTAERVRRVINGYSFTGTQRDELLREKITWTKFQQASRLLEQVEGLENAYGPSYDTIRKSVTNGELVVTGEKKVEEKAEGLGGTFTYCTLGDPIDMDRLLTGESLPSFEALASVLFHTATNTPLSTETMETDALGQPGHGYLGEAAGVHVWLIYQPDLEFLKSTDAALTLAKARSIAETREGRHVVFAPARFVSQKMLNDADLPVEFAPLPFALYRVERE